MALALYGKPTEESRLSNGSDGTLYEPFVCTFNGKSGGAISQQIYLRNDDLTRRYSNITLQAVDAAATSRVDNSVDGWFWKIMEKETAPTYEEWDEIVEGAAHTVSADIGNITQGDTSTYLSIWVRVEIPIEQPIQNITNITLNISATETVV